MFPLLNHPRALDPAAIVFLQRVAQSDRPSMADMTPADARASYDILNEMFDHAPQDVGSVNELRIPVTGGLIDARLFKGVNIIGNDEKSPLLIFVHGGGFVVGSLDGYDSLCRELANDIGCKILALDYRMAPEHRFPTAANDVFEVWQWVFSHADELGIDPQRVAGMGDSAGGNLTAQATSRIREEGLPVAGQVLVYPAVSEKNDTDSDKAYANGYLIDRRTMDWFMENYIDADHLRADQRLNLLAAENFSDCSPTYFQLAECDPLVDEATIFANVLLKAGNEVKLSLYPGMLHGFYHMPKLFPQAKIARGETVSWLKDIFKSV